MDYETKPISRSGLRSISKFVRQMFGCKSDNVPFPVIDALERLPDLFPDTNCVIVNDNELPGNVFACCSPKSEGGFVIKIKQTVYDDAYKNKNPAFLSFICHEICHVVLFYLGFAPISNVSISEKDKISAYRSVEWQTKALCGEVTIPYEATINMKAKEIMKKYNVTEAFAKYRVKQDKQQRNT